MLLAESTKKILAEIGLETKFKILDMTMLFLIHEGRSSLIQEKVPSIKALFFIDSPITMKRLSET